MSSQPTAAMLVIGDEILSGRTREGNGWHLAKELTEAGVSLREMRVVADGKADIVDAVKTLSEKYDYVFTSGGIGPTHDDITADCVAEAFGDSIGVRDDAHAILIDHYGTDDINEARLRMARIPDTATLIANPVSRAPGFRIGNVHVMAGKGGDERTFLSNLAFAAYEARDLGIGVLIEPINHYDAEDYFLSEIEQAAEYVEVRGAPNLKIMFDCYHVQVMQGDLERRLKAHLPLVGHIQIAAAPNRGEPNGGEISYDRLIPAIDAMGYDGFIGAEYKPSTTTDEGLGWMTAFSS